MNGRELKFIIPYLCVRLIKIKIKGKSLNFKHKNNSLSLRYFKKAYNKP
jgi:hypothetical protein